MTTGFPDGELILTAAGQHVTGWTDVNVTRGVERMPSDFQIGATAPGANTVGLNTLNAPATISIGGHVVLTGFVERAATRISPQEHAVMLVGRGRCCDIVDSAALLSNMTRVSTSVATLAQELLAPFANNSPVGPIQVLTPTGEGNGHLYTFAISLGESPYEIISRVARYEGLLAYEDADGNLVLSRVGPTTHASGFIEGENIQSAEFYAAMDERFSVYIPLMMTTDTLTRNGSVASGNAAGSPVNDPAITRYRPRIIVSEQMVNNDFLAQQRATWEATRRAGRSLRVTLVCDSWLDSAGTPWTPNMLAPVALPSSGLSLVNWVITEVTYRRDGQNGTQALVTLMPPAALDIEPAALNAITARSITPPPGGLGDPSTPTTPPTAPNAGGGAARPVTLPPENYGL